MRFYALLASLVLVGTFPADGQDFLTGSKRVLESMPRTVTSTATPRWHAQVITWYPHDVWAFTEGLLLYKGELFESTGFRGASSLRHVQLETGLVTQAIRLDSQDFGEGLAEVGHFLVQLTYQQNKAIIYELPSLKHVGQFSYTGEGWGLCYNGHHLIMSNGTDQLTLRDPRTFAVQSTISVTLDGQPQKNINELECVGDLVYANVFRTDSILEIGANGVVTKVIDLSDLLTQQERGCLGEGLLGAQQEAVLNGIAYDPADGTFLVTGKMWPKVFRVRFVQ